MSTLASVLRAAAESLQPYSASADIDAEYLLLHVLQKDRFWLRLHGQSEISAAVATQFDALLARRRNGEPVAYLTGMRGFWTLDLQVTPDVLIPRPETEMLVEFALEKIPSQSACRVLDLGTGSGAIALAVKAERPQAAVTAVDVSPAALAVAAANAARLNLDVEFVQGSWYAGVAARRFDLVLSNPPYIDSSDAHLDAGDLRFEPRSALVADDEGLRDIRMIAIGAPHALQENGWLAVEHGFAQGAAVRDIFAAAGFTDIATRRDISGHERITLGRHHAG